MSEMEYYTTKDVCELLKISSKTLYKYLEQGKIKGTKLGKSWRYSQKDIDEFIQNLQKEN